MKLTKAQELRRERLRAKLTKPKKKTQLHIIHAASGVKTLCGWDLSNNVVIGERATCKRCKEIIAMNNNKLVHAPFPDLLSPKLTLCGWNRTYTNLLVRTKSVTCKRCLECIAKVENERVHLSGGTYTMCGMKSEGLKLSSLKMDVSCKRCLVAK